jgi:hypothetical protein
MSVDSRSSIRTFKISRYGRITAISRPRSRTPLPPAPPEASRIVGMLARKSAIRFFCIWLARCGSVSIRWSMLASVLNQKCGSTCACIAAMRASTTWRRSDSASAVSAAIAALVSACFWPL